MLCSRRGRVCILLATILLAIGTANSQAPPKLNVDAKEKVVKGGEQFEFVCRAGIPIEACSVKFESTQDSFKIRDQAKKPEYEYFGNGFEKGDCGIRYFNVKKEQHGNVTCTLGFANFDKESIGSTNLIVAVPPKNIELRGQSEYVEGEEMRFVCQAFGARPAANVTLYLNEDLLASSSKMQDTVNFNRVASYKDNNKKLICKAGHQALEEEMRTEKTLSISFQPQPIGQFGANIQKFGFFENKEGVISVDVFANPKPRFDWKINGENPDRINYRPVQESQIRENPETGAWQAELLISEVSRADLDKEFVLTATNKYGYQVYNIRISFDPTPEIEGETDMGAGSIVAIIVAVLIVFVAIILTLFARMTGRWCFAEKAGRENHSNSEAQFDAEDKTAGNDNPNHDDDDPPNYQVISDTDHKSNGKKADKDTPV